MEIYVNPTSTHQITKAEQLANWLAMTKRFSLWLGFFLIFF